MDGLTEGRIVHFVLDEGRSIGEHRPAIIVKVWDDLGLVNLQVFTDGFNAANSNDGLPSVVWKTSIPHNEDKQESTWHWIEKA